MATPHIPRYLAATVGLGALFGCLGFGLGSLWTALPFALSAMTVALLLGPMLTRTRGEKGKYALAIFALVFGWLGAAFWAAVLPAAAVGDTGPATAIVVGVLMMCCAVSAPWFLSAIGFHRDSAAVG